MLDVYRTNAALLALTEAGGGRYALEYVGRHRAEARARAGLCHLLAVRSRASAAVVAVAEVLEENPGDGLPWIGLLMVHGEHRRAGLGRELAEALMAEGVSRLGWRRVRLVVQEDNALGMAFWPALGFAPVERLERDYPAGRLGLWRMERQLAPGAVTA
jgi:ribosomal protein S18 acetylase RimI-like enzyme